MMVWSTIHLSMCVCEYAHVPTDTQIQLHHVSIGEKTQANTHLQALELIQVDRRSCSWHAHIHACNFPKVHHSCRTEQMRSYGLTEQIQKHKHAQTWQHKDSLSVVQVMLTLWGASWDRDMKMFNPLITPVDPSKKLNSTDNKICGTRGKYSVTDWKCLGTHIHINLDRFKFNVKVKSILIWQYGSANVAPGSKSDK